MSKHPEPIRNAARATRRSAKFSFDACCLLCGTREPKVLVRATRSDLVDATDHAQPGGDTLRSKLRLVLEEHHLLERAVDRSVTVPLCRNCHALVHELLRDRGIDFKAEHLDGTLLHVVQTVLRVLATFHELLASFLASLADRLPTLIGGLDRGFPDWRALPGATWR